MYEAHLYYACWARLKLIVGEKSRANKNAGSGREGSGFADTSVCSLMHLSSERLHPKGKLNPDSTASPE